MSFERWLEQNPWPILVCITVPFALVGVYLIYTSLKVWRLVRSSQQWPTTFGRVVESDVEVVRKRASVSRTRTNITSYYPRVVYEYQVNGQAYQSRALALAYREGWASEGDAQAKAAEYPVGSTVQVHYNPQNPAQAALIPDAPLNWIPASVGVGLIIIMALVWLTAGNPAFTSGLTK
jgi:hypothetical protein